jgi:medium-chain acyl-[acyl-carrier-protein] hydrolase
MAETIQHQTPRGSAHPGHRDTRDPAPPVLFCLPFAGGGASAFCNWQEALGAGVEVRALQLPGRENLFDLQPLANMGALADHLLPQMLAHRARPFAVFGHSLGALVGYELCRRLDALDLVPRVLFASARNPPHASRSAPLHSLTDQALKLRLREFGGTPQRVLDNDGLMQQILPILRADLRVAETYLPPPAPPLRCPIVACGADDDVLAAPATMQAWDRYTSTGFELVHFTGGHFFLRTAQASLLALIRSTLAGTARKPEVQARPVLST